MKSCQPNFITLFLKTSNHFIKVVAARYSKWKVFQKKKQTFNLTSTIYLLLRCYTEKQIQQYKYYSPYRSYFYFKFFFFQLSCVHLFLCFVFRLTKVVENGPTQDTFLKSQGKFFLSFLYTLFYIFLTPKNYKSRL